jgi:hypothetical protein
VGPARKLDRPRRVTLEEFREQEELGRREMEDLRARMDEERRLAMLEEKENVMSEEEGRETNRHYSPPLTSRSAGSSSHLLARTSVMSSNQPLTDQRGQARRIAPVPNRTGRSAKSSKYTGTTLVGGGSENNVSGVLPEGSDNEYANGYRQDYDYGEVTDRGDLQFLIPLRQSYH